MEYGWEMMDNWNRPPFEIGLGLLALWSLVWKGLALWRASREQNKNWFIALLIINSAGILDIAYLFFFAKEKLTLATTASHKSKKK